MARLAFATMQVNKLYLTGDDAGKEHLNTAILGGTGTGQLGLVYAGPLREHDLGDNEVLIDAKWRDVAASIYVVGATDLEGLMNVGVMAITNKDNEIVAIGKTQAVNTYSGLLKTMEQASTGVYSLVFEDGTKIPLPGDPRDLPTRLNNSMTDARCMVGYEDYWHFLEATVTKDAQGKATFVCARHFCDPPTWAGPVTKSTTDPVTDTTVNLPDRGDGGSDLPVPVSARVTINGVIADRDDLKQWDVLYYCYDYSTAPHALALEIRAIRNTVQGKPTATRTSYPGPTYYATINGVEYVTGYQKDGTLVGPGLLNTTTTYKLALDAKDRVVTLILEEAPTSFVVVKEFTAYGDGTASVKVNIRGTEVTYAVGPD